MPHIPKAVCASCQEEYVIDKNGVRVEFLRNSVEPYYKIFGDRYRCPGCNHTIITGFAATPFVEHYMAGYDNALVEHTVRFP